MSDGKAFLRTHGLALVAIGVAVWVYVDVGGDVRELKGRLDGMGLPATVVGAPPSPAPESTPDASVAEPAWDCAGAISPDMVRTALGNHGRDVIDCHQSLPRGDGVARSFAVELLVGADGRVRSARLPGLDEPQLMACLEPKIFQWRFPPPVGGECAVVSAPFHLESPARPAPPERPDP